MKTKILLIILSFLILISIPTHLIIAKNTKSKTFTPLERVPQNFTSAITEDIVVKINRQFDKYINFKADYLDKELDWYLVMSGDNYIKPYVYTIKPERGITIYFVDKDFRELLKDGKEDIINNAIGVAYNCPFYVNGIENNMFWIDANALDKSEEDFKIGTDADVVSLTYSVAYSYGNYNKNGELISGIMEAINNVYMNLADYEILDMIFLCNESSNINKYLVYVETSEGVYVYAPELGGYFNGIASCSIFSVDGYLKIRELGFNGK